ncbi:hypothetical protein [Mycolicibacterium goodii]|uniref:hypothetical protein n=1 Tax=Mycolicibacterium goodii TaxID=134601 RepID=UPI001BDC53C4|nr:hypothetical protein [Mycolicibacterium goodii]MBU8832902.1 hypothetical protein [Mycolicibacterium goodii]
MSKTDKTTPFWVKLMRGDIASVEVHDHTDGTCDMPDAATPSGWTKHQGCHRAFVYTGTRVCCCPLCHGDGGWDVRPGKRQRLASRRMCRDWQSQL